MRYCRQCGAQVAEGDRFCEACGTAREAAETAAVPSSPAAPAARVAPPAPKGWRPGAVFWFGLILALLSFAAGASEGNILDGVLFVAINWTFFVLPVVVIRNIRRSRRQARATA
jgi:hypothetical protein